MTVEERAKKTLTEMWKSTDGGIMSHDIFMALIIQALRDQIEDCAKVAESAMEEPKILDSFGPHWIAKKIRARSESGKGE